MRVGFATEKRPRLGRGLLVIGLATASFVHPATSATVAAADGDTVDGRFSGVGFIDAGETIQLDVTGRGGTAGNSAAVSLNLTVTQTAGHGYATIYPCGSARPEASTINFGPGETIANSLISKVGSAGNVCIYSHTRAHVLVDVNGYFPAGSDYRPLTPARLLDTRSGSSTIDGRSAGSGIRNAGSVLQLDVTGRGGTAGNSAAVSLNLTVTQTAGHGYATIYPCGSARPEASTINFGPGETIANSLISKVGSAGKVCIYSHTRAHLIVDVDGYFPAGSDYRPITPARLLDTRSGSSTIDGRSAGSGIRNAGSVLQLDVTGRGGTAGNSAAVSLNLTVTQTAGHGYATIYPCGSARPEASTINFGPGETIANSLISKVGSGGNVCIYSHTRAHLIVDVNGYFPAGSDYRPTTPARLLDTRSAPPVLDAATERSLVLLNQLRAAHGAGPVAHDAAMSAIAMGWSQEMSRSGFRHSSVGYPENIAWHSSSTMSPFDAATTLHGMWENSSGHFSNMVNPRWERVGIGLHVDSSGWWGTHMFDD